MEILLELLEPLFELFFTMIVELVGHCYIKLMRLVVPEKTLTEKTKKRIKIAVTAVSVLLVVVLITGLCFWVQEDTAFKAVGKYMTYIPLAIIGLQIVLGIVMRIVSRKKK